MTAYTIMTFYVPLKTTVIIAWSCYLFSHVKQALKFLKKKKDTNAHDSAWPAAHVSS